MKWLVIVFNAHKHVSRVTCSIQFSFYVHMYTLVAWTQGVFSVAIIIIVIVAAAVVVQIFIVWG